MSIEKRSLTLTINGQKVGPVDAPVGMPMIDFLHDHLDLTGTRFVAGKVFAMHAPSWKFNPTEPP